MLSPIELREAVLAVQQINQNVGALAVRFKAVADAGSAAVQQVQRAGKDALAEGQKEFWSFTDQVEENFKNMARMGRQHMFELFEGLDKRLEVSQMKWQNYGEQIRRELTTARGALGSIGSGLGMTGGGGASAITGLLGSLPGGGVIGATVWLQKKKAEFQAAGVAVARAFDQVGQTSQAVFGRMAADVAKYWQSWGAGLHDLSALTAAFAEFGVSGDRAMVAVNVPTGRFKKDVLGLSFALDTATNSATGTFGKAIAQAMQTSGRSAKETAEGFFKIAASVRDAGINMTAFVGAIMQAQSALRVQRQDVGALSDAFLKMRKGLAGMLGIPEGGQTAGALALSGLGKVAGSIGNMSLPFLGYFGQQFFPGKSPGEQILQTYYGMQAAKEGGGTGMLESMVMKLGELADTFQGNESDRILGLSQMGAGFDLEGATALYKYYQMSKAGAGGASEEQLKAMRKEVQEAFGRRGEQWSPYEKFMRDAIMAFGRIGQGILTAIISGVLMLRHLPGAILKREGDEAALARLGQISGGAFQDILGAGKGAGKGALELFGNTFLTPELQKYLAGDAPAPVPPPGPAAADAEAAVQALIASSIASRPRGPEQTKTLRGIAKDALQKARDDLAAESKGTWGGLLGVESSAEAIQVRAQQILRTPRYRAAITNLEIELTPLGSDNAEATPTGASAAGTGGR